jgi:hypothetical protein
LRWWISPPFLKTTLFFLFILNGFPVHG